MFRFIEGDFEEYVRNIEQPYSWGGEPELLMAAHVLQWVPSYFFLSIYTHLLLLDFIFLTEAWMFSFAFIVTWFCWWYRTPITVFVKDRNSSKLEKIARYGIEYEQDGEAPLNVLFYHYGHYDLVEGMLDWNARMLYLTISEDTFLSYMPLLSKFLYMTNEQGIFGYYNVLDSGVAHADWNKFVPGNRYLTY